MFTRKRKIACILLVLVCIATLFLVSCKKDPVNPDNPNNNTPSTNYGIDSVYFTVDGENEYLFTISGNTFMISGINGDQAGTFTYENGALTLTFKEGDSTNASAALENGVLKLTYNGSTYRMLPRNRYNVTFDVDGGSEVAAQKVLNGRYAAKPDDPVKAGYAFIGWYADKAYTTVFNFDTAAISADTTVYARFEAQPTGQIEYTVGFVCEGEAFGALKTINGVLHTLPTPAAKDGMEFAGWWISDYQSGEKLTCQYTGQKLTQDTLLYAVYKSADTPLVSVNASGASWNALGANITYRVVVKRGNNTLADTNTGNTSFGFDFAEEVAGDYIVTVTANGKSASSYYRNKAIDRASGIRIVSSNVLVFNPVANAQNYTITVICGTPGHEHEKLNNSKSTNFVFANCDMPKDGIRFVITASADGYLSSTVTYTLFRGLDAVEGISIDNEKITWFPTENATGYLVGISTNGTDYKSYYVSGDTSYDITGLNKGQLYVTVTPVSAGYYSAPATPVQYSKTTLAKPSGITVSGSTLEWNEVEGATGYIVTINGTEYRVNGTEASMDLSKIVSAGTTAYDVTVQAVTENAAESSPASDTVRINYARMGTVTYKNGKIYWEPVYGAEKYIIRVGSAIYTVEGDQSSFEVTFVQSGITEISVRFTNANGEKSMESTTEVEVYGIELDSCGGTAVPGSIYKAYGDNITLPETTREGYNFAGWYLTPDSIASGKPYTATVFEERHNMLLFATWSYRHFNVKLNPGTNGSVSSDELDVVYGKYNKAPTASTTDESRYFYGWYTEPNGGGIRYFDESGNALVRWNIANDVQLYAFYPEFLKFELLGDKKSYSVSQGNFGLGNLQVLKIPATYNGLPVTTIEAEGFYYCTTLTKVRIPNTILNIELGTSGVNSEGSAFHSCRNLAEFEVYDAGSKDPLYFTDNDGVLYHKNEKENTIELAAFPYAKSGVYTIWEGTTAIPGGVFTYVHATEINIPYTVTKIGYRAITGSFIEKINFLAPPEGVTAAGLEMEENAISDCKNLTEIILPGRISEFAPSAINGCNALTSIDLAGESAQYSTVGADGRKVLASKDGKTIIYCPKGMEGEYTIPAGVDTIDERAFANCTKLTKVTIPGYVKEIKTGAFRYCTGIISLDLTEDGQPLTIGASAFYNCSALSSLTLPERLVKMEKNAFGYIQNLTKVTINSAGANGKVTFANVAFGSEAKSPSYFVTDIVIGKDVPAFNITGVFGQKLERITVAEGNSNYATIKEHEGVLYNGDFTEVIFYASTRKGDYTLPDTITTIGSGVFKGKALTGITIGNQVKSIADSAFESCKQLKFVTFKETEEGKTPVALTIGASAFKNCSALAELKLPTRLTFIGASAFYACDGIESVDIPEGVTSIGDLAFSNCDGLVSVSLPSTLTTLSISTASSTKGAMAIFDSSSSLAYITIKTSTVKTSTGETVEKVNEAYAAEDNILYAIAAKKDKDGNIVKDSNGKTVYIKTKLLYCPERKAGATDIEIPDTVTEVLPRAFERNKVVTSVSFADAEKFTIGSQAFYNCAQLASVSLPAGLGEIANSMFESCLKLTEITIPYTVATIQNEAFYFCKNLSTVNFAPTPAGKTPVSLVVAAARSSMYSPFASCPSVKTIAFPERTTVIGNYAFGNSGPYQGIESVSLPSTLTQIGDNAFYYAAALTSVQFPSSTNLVSIGKNAFSGCHTLKDFNLPNSTQSYTIGSNAFYNCALTSLTIPACVSKIDSSAFDSCYCLKSVTFGENFKGAALTMGTSVFARTGITSITLPEGITSIPSTTFWKCAALTSIHIPATVTSIGSQAFSECISMTSVIFDTYTNEKDGNDYARVKNIGYQAFEKTKLTSFAFPTLEGTSTITLGNKLFQYCGELTTVSLSKSIGEIGQAFDNNTSIKSFVVAADSKNFSAEGQILYNADKTAIRAIMGLLEGAYEIPAGVKEINEYAFRGQVGVTAIIIPASVTKIGKYAFENCYSLTSVTFAHGTNENAPTLGTNIFNNCSSLSSVTLPAKLTSIPERMFAACTALETITLPAKLASIGDNAFWKAGLTSIKIPATVKSIGKGAFEISSSSAPGKLQSLTFEKDSTGACALTTIGQTAFKYQSMTSVTLPKSVSSVGSNAFSYNPQLTSFTIEAGTALTILPNALVSNCTMLTSFTIPKEITKIDSNAFNGCSALTSITIPSDSELTVIGSKAFASSGLTNFAVPSKVVTILSSAFSHCEALTSVTFAADADLVGIGENCFEYSGLESIVLPEKVTMLGSVSSSGKVTAKATTTGMQFYNCEKLESVSFAGKVTALGAGIFNGCVKLQSISLPETVTIIGNTCFYNCTELKSVEIKSTGALTFGTGAFKKSGLTSIKIPGGVTKTGKETFSDCVNLASVEFEYGTGSLTIEEQAFGRSGLVSVTIPARTIEIKGRSSGVNVCSAFEGCEKLESVVFEEGTTTLKLATYVFSRCPALKTVVLSSNIVSIPSWAFEYDDALNSITLPNVSTISSYAFRGCSSLESIDLSSVTEIGANAFLNSGLRSLTIPKACTAIGDNAFAGCLNLNNFTVDKENPVFASYPFTENENALVRKGDLFEFVAMPRTVTGTITLPKGYTIGAYALNGISGVTGVILPEGLTEIPAYAFAYSSITSITIPETVTYIGNGAFYGSALTSITIPANVTTLEDSVFKNCEALTSVTFAPNSKLSYIGYNTFEGSAIKSIIIPENVLYFADTVDRTSYTFRNCTQLESVTFLGKLKALNGELFKGCTALKHFTIPSTIEYIGSNVFEGAGLVSIEIPAGIPSLGITTTSAGIENSTSLFLNCTSLETVILHEGLQYINYGAFDGCSSLKSIVIPSTVYGIDVAAFRGCTALETITIKDGSVLKTIGNEAFKNSGITSIVIPATVKRLGTNVFQDSAKLKSVSFLGSLRELPNYTFTNCSSLETFNFPKDILGLGANLFEGTALKSVVIPGTIALWNGSSTFLNCTKLETVVMEEGLRSMSPTNMFKGCTNLRSVKIPSTITTITTNAFEGCTALSVIELPVNITKIESKAFMGWTAAQTIRFAGSRKMIGTFDSAWANDCNAKIVWNYKQD